MFNAELDHIREQVLPVMIEIGVIDFTQANNLRKVPLGILRRNATRMHAVCRYRPGPRGGSKGINDVREIALHPVAIEDDWRHYAQFLMYHEMLHAIGHVRHDRLFRDLEARWPDQNARESGPSFGQHLRQRAARWLWTCPKCKREHHRSRRSNGRYLCRVCRVKLIDVPTGQTHDTAS
ncbi:MAG: hypothetical protein VX433_04145 [Candidatus Thermoplasmatota archaeon]|nr:hypothetical protein [Candidatus Thermoplasmatota archaeon]